MALKTTLSAGMKQTAGTHTKQLTELVDVLPTLIQLGGLTLPTNEVRCLIWRSFCSSFYTNADASQDCSVWVRRQTFDGVSLVPLVAGTVTTTGKNMSFSQYARDEPLHPA